MKFVVSIQNLYIKKQDNHKEISMIFNFYSLKFLSAKKNYYNPLYRRIKKTLIILNRKNKIILFKYEKIEKT